MYNRLKGYKYKGEYDPCGHTLIDRSGGAPGIYLEIRWWISRT